MTRTYNVKTPSRRWPVQVFFNILNLSIINSWVLYTQTTGIKITRRNFIVKLVEEICVLKNPQSSLQSVSVSPLSGYLRSSSSPSLPPKSPLTPHSAKRAQSRSTSSAKKKICIENDTPLPAKTILGYCKIKIRCTGHTRSTYICKSCQTPLCSACCDKIYQLATCIECGKENC
jgi:hypothetical protein